jgi:hypothetical protein
MGDLTNRKKIWQVTNNAWEDIGKIIHTWVYLKMGSYASTNAFLANLDSFVRLVFSQQNENILRGVNGYQPLMWVKYANIC